MRISHKKSHKQSRAQRALAMCQRDGTRYIKVTYTTALLYTIPPFNKLNLSGLWPIVRSSTACMYIENSKARSFSH